MAVHMCIPNLKMTSADKLDVEEQYHPIEPGLLQIVFGYLSSNL